MEYPCYAYLDCDLLDNATLTIIIVKVKSSHIKINEHHMQKCMFVKVKKFRIESKFKRGFEKGDMHVIIIELITIVSLIIFVGPKLIPMFFHINSIRKFINSLQS
jgi:hypothetical protein